MEPTESEPTAHPEGQQPANNPEEGESGEIGESRGVKRTFAEITNVESSDLPPALGDAQCTNSCAVSCAAPCCTTNVAATTTAESKSEEHECGESVEHKDWSHITEADLELKEFKCPRCSMAFKTTNDLFVHMRETYDDPTVCQVCGKNLNCMANVLSHSYVHQDLKPYHCPKCKYQTRTRFNLRVHFGSCAKLEKFSYKRGHCAKRRRTINTKNRKRAKRASRKRMDCLEDTGILSHMYDDILNQLADSGPYTDGARDVSCLVQVHIQHFPRNNANGTDRFYQQNEAAKRPQMQQVPPITDVSQFYAEQQAAQPQW